MAAFDTFPSRVEEYLCVTTLLIPVPFYFIFTEDGVFRKPAGEARDPLF